MIDQKGIKTVNFSLQFSNKDKNSLRKDVGVIFVCDISERVNFLFILAFFYRQNTKSVKT